MTIQDVITKIKASSYGKEARAPIYNGLLIVYGKIISLLSKSKTETAEYDKAIQNFTSSSPSNAEIVAARTDINDKTYDTLKARLDAMQTESSENESYIGATQDIVEKLQTMHTKNKEDIASAQADILKTTNLNTNAYSVLTRAKTILDSNATTLSNVSGVLNNGLFRTEIIDTFEPEVKRYWYEELYADIPTVSGYTPILYYPSYVSESEFVIMECRPTSDGRLYLYVFNNGEATAGVVEVTVVYYKKVVWLS